MKDKIASNQRKVNEWFRVRTETWGHVYHVQAIAMGYIPHKTIVEFMIKDRKELIKLLKSL